jgi:DNA polymerase, archaea type
MVPIEADTDGVYFATPREWSEVEERALVDEIGTTLPEVIRLEYESHYAAMVSHAIKNYALLFYSGELLVRCALQPLRTFRRALLDPGVPLHHA